MFRYAARMCSKIFRSDDYLKVAMEDKFKKESLFGVLCVTSEFQCIAAEYFFANRRRKHALEL